MTNKTVTMSRELADRLDNPHSYVRNLAREELRALLAAPVVERQPVAWDSAKPSAPGAYWVRGNGLVRDALIQVIEEEGELRCNLHIRTTEDDFGYGYSIDQLSDEFEWLGPLFASPPAPVAVNARMAAILQSLRTNANPALFAPGQLAEVDACLDKVKEMNQ